MNQNRQVWNRHYTREKSKLVYPDENIVRFVARRIRGFDKKALKQFTVLDLGCGSGRHLQYLRSCGLSAIGQDFAGEALAGQRDVLLANAEQLPYRDGSFDLVIAWGVLHYLDEKKRSCSIREIMRVLKPGASLLATVRAKDDSHLEKTMTGGDLQGARAWYFSPAGARRLFKAFARVHYGYMARIFPGEKNKIAHHIIEAVRATA